MESYPEKGTWRGTGVPPCGVIDKASSQGGIPGLTTSLSLCETSASGRYKGPLRAQPPAA